MQVDDLRAELGSALLAVDRVQFKRLLENARSGGMTTSAITDLLVLPLMENLGAGWEKGEVSLSQVFMAGRLVEEAARQLLYAPESNPSQSNNIAVALLDDHHMLGKQMVLSSLRIAGFQVHDYGRVKADELVRRIQEDGIELVLISTLMLRSALLVKEVRSGLSQAGLAVKIYVGGAPFRFDQNLWREVGADAFGNNAADAIRLVRDFAANQTGELGI